MKKYKKNILLFSLVSLLLASCGKTDEIDSLDNNEIVVVRDTTKEDLSKKKSDAEIFGTKDISDHGLYDDTMIVGLSVKQATDDSSAKYLMTQTHRLMFDKEEYGTVQEFLDDAKECTLGYLTDEEFDEADILVIITTYQGIDGHSFLSEKRTIIESPDRSNIIVAISRTFIDDEKEFGVRVDNFSINGTQKTFGAYDINHEIIDIDPEIAGSILTEFSIPTGVYRKEDLLNLLDEEKGKGLYLE